MASFSDHCSSAASPALIMDARTNLTRIRSSPSRGSGYSLPGPVFKADQAGTVVEILIDDAKPVSVDTPLFVIAP